MRSRAGLQKLLLPRREIALRCRMPGKFLEKMREKGLRVVQARCAQENELRLRVRGRDAQAVRELAERYSLPLLSDAPCGPDVRALLGRACPFALGLYAALAVFSYASAYIWQIDVRCPQGGEPGQVRFALREAGVRPGGAFPQEDPLARELESLCPGYAHISVRREGVVLLVEAYRETEAPEVYDVAAARDLVARYDAVVEEITVLSGTAAARPGDVVRAGQALILGEEKETDETTRGVRALGEATGMIWVWAEERAECVQQERFFTGRERTRASLHLPGMQLPLSQAEDFALQEVQSVRAEIGGLFFPLYIERETLREVALRPKQADMEQLRAALEAKALAHAAAKLPDNAQIVDKWAEYSMMEGKWQTVRLCLQARVPLAVARGAELP